MKRKAKEPQKRNFKKDRTFYFLVAFAFLVLLLTLANLKIIFMKPGVQKVLGVKNTYDKNKAYWLEILSYYPDYFPGWIELTKLELEEGNLEKARDAFIKAGEIMPNSKELVPFTENFKN